MSDIDGGRDIKDIKKRGKGREMSDIDGGRDIDDIKMRGKGRNERY